MPSTSISTQSFLKDILICSLGAYGGPSAHYGVFTNQLISKKHYITEEELIELIALCSVLPGPTSTQTIVSIGYKIGGPKLAFLTMLVWSVPAILIMTLLSFLYQGLKAMNVTSDVLKFIGPMAVGFIILAAYRIGKKVVTSGFTFTLALISATVTYFLRDPWIFPLILIGGGLLSIFFSGEKNLWQSVRLSPPWRYFIAFVLIAFGALISIQLTDNRLVHLFESFYRYGYLVFGGGQVVIPVMFSEMVDLNHYMTSDQFLTGYGLVQGIPGPMFSFSAYAGGLAAADLGTLKHIGGSLLGGLGIFLPGLLLIFFVYPIWDHLRQIKGIKIALIGINAIAGGLIAVSAIILMQKTGFTPLNLGIALITTLLLASGKIPAPLIVVGALTLGFIV